MNLFDFVTIAAMVAAGYYCGRLLSTHFSLVGWITGFVIGGSAPILVRHLMGYVLHKWYPSRPPCRNGKCLADDYTQIEIRQQGDRFAIVWRCKCATMYLQRFPYFQEMLPDGSVRPYMRKIRGRWKADVVAEVKRDGGTAGQS